MKLKKCIVKCLIISMFAGIIGASSTKIKVEAETGNSNLKSTISAERQNSYSKYLELYTGKKLPQDEIIIPISNYKESGGKVEVSENFAGSREKVLKTSEEGYVEWEFEVKKDGLYNIEIEYYPLEGRSSEIERELQINGALPFNEAKSLTFSRIWKDNGEITQDNRGNDVRPKQIESPNWQTQFLKDRSGYYTEPYKFYFKEGKNSIKLISVKEPLAIRSIRLCQIPFVPSYEKIVDEYKTKGYKPANSGPIKVQGEAADYKSDPTLIPVYDRSTPNIEPYHPSKIRYNSIGGSRWKLPGQWLEWGIEVPEDGLYKIALKVKQNAVRGSFTNRKLTIDNKLPFKEVENISFKYNENWDMLTLGDSEGKPYEFYLTKGKHNLRLEVVLSGLSEILRVAENSVFALNTCYRNILMLTGATPDIYRDYQIDKKLPEIIKSFKEQSEILNQLSLKLRDLTGERGSHAAILDRLSYQLKDMVEDPDTIPKRLDNFKTNVGALGNWILATKEQPLEIDYITVYSKEEEINKKGAGWLARLVHEIRSFTASFFEDYNSIGDTFKDEALEVWITSGRDQSQILKEMIDDSFTSKTGIKVNLKLVQASVLLPSTVAGRAPDVAMNVGNGDPINYAMRNAIYDLSKFSDYKDIEKRFNPSALVPFRFNNGVFALPETQTFPMMFYRKDILEEMNIKLPETWEEVTHLMPELQKNYMNFAIPEAPLTAYSMMLYQRNGSLYKEEGIASNLDSDVSLDVFKRWTEFYTNFSLPLKFDFQNRFRIGEIPIGIADYGMYNNLSVFAPELRGLWEFCPVPGVKQADGTINRSVPSGGAAAMIMEESDKKDKAWEFIKWWTSSEAQVRFGREMESLLGAAARYPTANIEALGQLSWPVKDYKNLTAQWQWVKGNPEVPGGYFTPRHLTNAFRAVINNGADPRETLLDYVRVINDEIDIKREEFGLPVKK